MDLTNNDDEFAPLQTAETGKTDLERSSNEDQSNYESIIKFNFSLILIYLMYK